MSWNNHDALHRHACHAYEDFRELRKRLKQCGLPDPLDPDLWHSISHHLRHAVFRSGHEVAQPRIRAIRRSHVGSQHR